MKFPHWVVFVLLVATQVAPLVAEKTPAKYAGLATVLIGIVGTVYVEAKKAEGAS